MKTIAKEKKTVEFMIRYYCRRIHRQDYLCSDCKELIDYTRLKLDQCRYGDEKMSCTRCETHCYQKEQREKIKKIMRYVGPRMIFLHPISVLRHKRILH